MPFGKTERRRVSWPSASAADTLRWRRLRLSGFLSETHRFRGGLEDWGWKREIYGKVVEARE